MKKRAGKVVSKQGPVTQVFDRPFSVLANKNVVFDDENKGHQLGDCSGCDIATNSQRRINDSTPHPETRAEGKSSIHLLNNELTFERDGAGRLAATASAALPEIEAVLAQLDPDKAGIRLHGIDSLRAYLTPGGPIGDIAVGTIGPAARPVRAILFDKTPTTNWSLGWHQDRTIVVAERREVPGFGPWTVKAGLLHVAPPFELLSRMVTLRVHLDPVAKDNAPLLIAPGSHRFGRVLESDIDSVVARCGVATCLAGAGDVWLYATPILHASDAASAPGRRRVLQIDYAAEALPGGLAWFGI